MVHLDIQIRSYELEMIRQHQVALDPTARHFPAAFQIDVGEGAFVVDVMATRP
jgi:hypothetical protein